MAKLNAQRRTLLQTVGVGAAGLLTAAGLTLAGAQCNAQSGGLSSSLRALLSGRQWLNTAALNEGDVAGRVVLVNFWTYSCINSLRTLPYLAAWARKYVDRGLVVVGVHTPEFQFEHDLERVRRANADEGVVYPVVLDNEYAIWSAFENNAWPGFYFVDARGRVRHRVLGEGGYDESERWLQRLLSERGARVDDAIVAVPGRGSQAAPDWSNIRSPESYVGYDKAVNFVARSGGLREGRVATYEVAPTLSLNQWSLSGAWNVGAEYATLDAPGGAVRFRFHARDLHFVLGRGSQTIRYRITIDGAAPSDNAGTDVNAAGEGVIDAARMYQLVRQSGRIQDRTFEITFLDPGAHAYVFTFG